MRYISTRGEAAPQSFLEVLFAGLAPDGGLFMPEAWPRFSANEIAAFKDQRYADVAFTILSRFAGASLADGELKADIDAAYANFDSPEIAPLTLIGRNQYLLELFHGPTLAFKDIAMQVLGRLFARGMTKRGGRATIVAATSGDTGSAAIAALGGQPNVEIFVLHPHERVSEMQRRQMTTSPHCNVHNIAVRGSFDDAQAIVKGLFADQAFARHVSLTAVNSINFARIAAQSVYYFTAAARLEVPAVFVVPTGNFGDVFAGEAAMRMGLAVDKLVVATNVNDIMVRVLNNGMYAAGAARHTLSPAMDIQVASNFERALFEASGRDAEYVRVAMSEFTNNPRLQIPPKILGALQARYAANRADDSETISTIKKVHSETGKIVDPHTAVALAAAHKYGGPNGVPLVILSTAHPAKFPAAIEAAIGKKPLLPERLSTLLSLAEKLSVLDARLPLVRAFIEARLAHHES
jgi:threonine synthase